ncbi:porin [Cupriavidus sp. 30B13]|uniref:porin n=1 Tax=Cupriavidus sp. 30B13 TaxID=3384241 RepID=UPI003B906050
MKKIVVLVAACATGYAGASQAADAVTLYGVINSGLSFTNNAGGHSQAGATSGDIQGSHWGLAGSEDLGGSTRGIFRLESGFNAQTGNSTQKRLFGFQAYVGLDDRRLGTLTVGRQYDELSDFVRPSHVPVSNNLGAHPFDNDNLNHGFRVNNAVKYRATPFDGFQVGALYGFSDATGFSDNRAWSLGARYATGNWRFAVAYDSIHAADGGNTGGAITLTDRTFLADTQRILGASATYLLGAAKINVLWTRSYFDKLNSIASLGAPAIARHDDSARFDNYELNASFPLARAWTLTAAYTLTAATVKDAGGEHNPRWNDVSLLLQYAFSRRTDFYVEEVYQHLNGDGSGLTAQISRQSAASGPMQSVVSIGMLHRF